MAGMFDFMDSEGFQNVVNDPNFLQTAGNIGQGISEGKSMGEVLNPSNMIRNIQAQKAGSTVSGGNQQLMAMLSKILDGNSAVEMPATQPSNLDPNGMSMAPSNQFSALEPTPLGQEGPDSVITKRTADGETVTVKTPSKRNLETFGSNVPLEAQPKQDAFRSPFSQALLSLA